VEQFIVSTFKITGIPEEANSWYPSIYFDSGSVEVSPNTLGPDQGYLAVLESGMYHIRFSISELEPGSDTETEIAHKDVTLNVAYGETITFNWDASNSGIVPIAGTLIALLVGIILLRKNK
jgi:hypothetical protein